MQQTRLVNAVVMGNELILSGSKERAPESEMRSWGPSRTIRAEVIRDIVLGRLAPEPDPRGLRLWGARIDGRLDLQNVTSQIPIELYGCLLDQGMNVRGAHLTTLGLAGCRLEHLTDPPVAGDGLTATSSVYLNRAVVEGDCAGGVVVLTAARISGQLDCEEAVLHNGSGSAFSADQLQVDRGVSLEGLQATAAGDCAVRMLGARIGGQLNCSAAVLTGESGPALAADGLQVEQGVYMQRFQAVGAGGLGAVRLSSGRIGSQLDCAGAVLRNASGPALSADGLQVDGVVHLAEGFQALGDGGDGAVRLPGARIAGQLICVGAALRNGSGPALAADELQVGQGISLMEGFEAVGSGGDGAVRLLGARISGQLICAEAVLRNESGPALIADRLQADKDVLLRRGFEAVGAGGDGAVRLLGARISGQLDCAGAVLHNESGPALLADGLQVDQNMSLVDGFQAVGAGEYGAVRIAGGRIGGQLTCAGAVLRNESGPALSADRLQIDQNVFLGPGLQAIGDGDSDVVLNLTGVRVAGVLRMSLTRWEHRQDPHRRLIADGLTYTGIPGDPIGKTWLKLLRDATPGYAAQPYQQLAAGHRASGHDAAARRVLIQQRRDQLDRRALNGRTERTWAKITGITLGFGYQPWRALLFLIAFVATSVSLALTLGGHHGGLASRAPTTPLAQSSASTAPVPCSTVDQIGIGLDVGLPLVKIASRDRFQPTPTGAGQSLTIASWVLQILAWTSTTLFIAGFTNAVRKP